MAIADPTRRKILSLLTAGALTVNAIATQFDISRPAVSKHLKALSEASLINIADNGRERLCTLNEEGFDEIRDWLTFFDKFWNKKLKNLENLLNKQ